MVLLPWIAFLVLVLGMLALDLGVLNRKAHVVSFKESLLWTLLWVGVSLSFNAFIYFAYEHHILGIGINIGHDVGGRTAAAEFFLGYVIEKSLSLDNIFVIALVFSYFKVPAEIQHRCLFWGILGALIMRGAMIGAGVALLRQFSWVNYVFGGLLIFSAIKMMVSKSEDIDPERNVLVRIAQRLFRVHKKFDGGHFFTHVDGKRAATLLFVVLLVVESADVMFAVDSIPAIFAVTDDPFIVFTSNICAILGLRSLYFALAAVLDKFRYLQMSLVFLLGYVGVKMLLAHHYPIPTEVSLALIGGILGLGIAASIWSAYREED